MEILPLSLILKKEVGKFQELYPYDFHENKLLNTAEFRKVLAYVEEQLIGMEIQSGEKKEQLNWYDLIMMSFGALDRFVKIEQAKELLRMNGIQMHDSNNNTHS
jgi:hypothetical protein